MADVSSNLKDWSATASSNSPSGSTNIGTGLDDNLREIQKVVRQDLATKGADIASATTTDVGAVAGLMHDITGTTTITGLGTVAAGIWKILKFEGALTLTHNATSLILPGGANITTADGDIGIFISEGSGNWRCVSYSKTSGAPLVSSVVRGYMAGCTLSNNGSDATNDIDVAAGVCADSTNAVMITVAALTKRLDAGWAAGTNQGMRNSGAAITDTTYHIYAVSKADGTQDIYAHTSTTVATVIAALQAETGGASYLYARRIGSIIRSGSAILGFVQNGDLFVWKVPINNVNATNPGASAVSATLSVPTGIVVTAKVSAIAINVTTANISLYLSDLAQTDSTPDLVSFSTVPTAANGANAVQGSEAYVTTNTSQQIRYRLSASGASDVVRIATQGWIDTRGRNA